MKIVNKIWTRSYEQIEEYEAGVVLTGAEYKSLYEGRAKLEAAYVKIKGDEAWLYNMEIFKYRFDGSLEYEPTRIRKLLLNRREILRWQTKMASEPRLTIIPTACYSKGPKIKVRIALVRGRTNTQKRRLERDAKVKRAQEREAKSYMKK
ncbi:MAG: SsrA-binding protein [Patescibacteria group bacterium]